MSAQIKQFSAPIMSLEDRIQELSDSVKSLQKARHEGRGESKLQTLLRLRVAIEGLMQIDLAEGDGGEEDEALMDRLVDLETEISRTIISLPAQSPTDVLHKMAFWYLSLDAPNGELDFDSLELRDWAAYSAFKDMLAIADNAELKSMLSTFRQLD